MLCSLAWQTQFLIATLRNEGSQTYQLCKLHQLFNSSCTRQIGLCHSGLWLSEYRNNLSLSWVRVFLDWSSWRFAVKGIWKAESEYRLLPSHHPTYKPPHPLNDIHVSVIFIILKSRIYYCFKIKQIVDAYQLGWNSTGLNSLTTS